MDLSNDDKLSHKWNILFFYLGKFVETKRSS